MRRNGYEGSGFVDMIGSLHARNATKAMLTITAKMAMRGTLNAAKKAVPHLIAHNIATTVAAAASAAVVAAAPAAAKKQKRVYIDAKHIQKPQFFRFSWVQVVLI